MPPCFAFLKRLPSHPRKPHYNFCQIAWLPLSCLLRDSQISHNLCKKYRLVSLLIFFFFPKSNLGHLHPSHKLLSASPPKPKIQGKLASLSKQVKRRDKIYCQCHYITVYFRVQNSLIFTSLLLCDFYPCPEIPLMWIQPLNIKTTFFWDSLTIVQIICRTLDPLSHSVQF